MPCPQMVKRRVECSCLYSRFLGPPDMKFNKVLVDPGNGQILQSKELSMMDWMMMMHSGGHEGMK